MRRREQVLLFQKKAAEDLGLVDEVLNSTRVTDEIIGFHCQQAAEKLLKAALSDLGVEFRRTHDLRELMDLLGDAGQPLPRTLARLDTLTPYATLFRYEGIPAKASLDRQKARRMIQRLQDWVQKRLGSAAQ